MAVLNDLIAQIENAELRRRIEAEVERLNKQKKFGLVFEDHLPECTPLYDIPVKVGSSVALRAGQVNEVYKVLKIEGEEATCAKKDASDIITFNLNDLVSVAEFGEAIYPYLKPLDSVCNAPDSDLWHTLIEADNYHALQLLEYLYAGKVDCIYIDPPYNTGARDWKYNNDYVDGADAYRHSKWLSFMEKRLKLAHKLLNPKDSVLIVTIDEKEYLHLGCLLEELFPNATIQMISSVINPNGSMRSDAFSRTDEYIFFVMFGEACPQKVVLDNDWLGKVQNTIKNKIHWMSLRRTGTNRYRHERPNLFYPIYLSLDGKRIVEVGDPIPLNVDRTTVPEKPDCITLWPLMPDGTECRWQMGADTLRETIAHHYVQIGTFKGEQTPILYLNKTEQQKIIDNNIVPLGYNEDGSMILPNEEIEARFIPGTQWWISSHDANRNGTKLINNILGTGRFSFPKSLYAVHDAIRFFVSHKKNALIIDFFAGSGTTLHAVNLLNAEDDGKRRCIIVTNNEVSAEEAKVLSSKGFRPGDDEWNQLGIARYVTWPRTVCSIQGRDVKGNPLKGTYIGSDVPMEKGFKANANFFKLGFLDKNAVALGRQFKELVPVLWMKAGAIGECPVLEEDNPGMLVMPKNKFAVLADERRYLEFVEELDKYPEIETVYIVTDSERAYRDMIAFMDGKNTYQLYRDYLDNFRINSVRR